MASSSAKQAAVVTWQTAEMVKYACNAFHALKITFANEIGRLGKHIGVDAVAVMDLLCRDTKLNISTSYLRPGNPFGGSCLPKDLNALTNHARQEGVHLPVLEHLVASNERHLQSILRLVLSSEFDEVVILGLAFKENTDDLRESAMVEVAQVLLGRGYKVRIYDPALNLGAIVGANRRVIDTRMPHLASLLQARSGCRARRAGADRGRPALRHAGGAAPGGDPTPSHARRERLARAAAAACPLHGTLLVTSVLILVENLPGPARSARLAGGVARCATRGTRSWSSVRGCGGFTNRTSGWTGSTSTATGSVKRPDRSPGFSGSTPPLSWGKPGSPGESGAATVPQ